MMMMSTMRMTREHPPSHSFIFIFLGMVGVYWRQQWCWWCCLMWQWLWSWYFCSIGSGDGGRQFWVCQVAVLAVMVISDVINMTVSFGVDSFAAIVLGIIRNLKTWSLTATSTSSSVSLKIAGTSSCLPPMWTLCQSCSIYYRKLLDHNHVPCEYDE